MLIHHDMHLVLQPYAVGADGCLVVQYIVDLVVPECVGPKRLSLRGASISRGPDDGSRHHGGRKHGVSPPAAPCSPPFLFLATCRSLPAVTPARHEDIALREFLPSTACYVGPPPARESGTETSTRTPTAETVTARGD